MNGPLPLEPKPDEMRAMGERVVQEAVAFLEGLEDAPAVAIEGGVDVARRLRAAPPELGTGDLDALLADAMDAARHTSEFAGPGYLAYIPGGGLYSAALGQFLTMVVNRHVSGWAVSPAMVQIEENVTRWLCSLFDMPETAQGILTTGGSLANLSAFVTARTVRLDEDFLDGTYYVTDQAHASIAKAARIAGFPERSLRTVPTDDRLRMDPAALSAAVAADRAAGLRPFLVSVAAGTTNTGAVDPIDEVADVAAELGLWLHVDAAYGGFFQLTDRGRTLFRGIERADSITLDPHKGMFLSYGTGGLVVRDGDDLRAAHADSPDYLQDQALVGELPNYREYSPELSRDMRGMRVWFPLVLHGVDAFREALDEKLDLARHLHGELAADPRLEVPWEPSLTVVPFRLRDGGAAANERLLAAINASKRVYLSSTLVRGEYWIRPCIVSHRTHRDRLDECVTIIRGAVDEIAG